jgi:hypothetical protein
MSFVNCPKVTGSEVARGVALVANFVELQDRRGCPGSFDGVDIFENDDPGLGSGNEVPQHPEEAGLWPVKPLPACLGLGDILAGESSGDDVPLASMRNNCCDISVDGSAGEVFGRESLKVDVGLNDSSGNNSVDVAGSEGEGADSSKGVAQAKHFSSVFFERWVLPLRTLSAGVETLARQTRPSCLRSRST